MVDVPTMSMRLTGQTMCSIKAYLGGGGQRHLLNLYTAELEHNVGTFLAFLWTSNWHEWYVSEGPGFEFKVRLCPCGGHAQQLGTLVPIRSSHECNFPNHMERTLPLKIISEDLTFANHVAVL